jgi:putative heme-binding domain-containing protein
MRVELLFGALAALIAATAQAAPSAAEVAQGGNLFSITCSSSFCHGEAGIGARGPSLRNRNFPPDFVRNTVLNGRSGTPMPSFKDSLSQAELNMIVGYVMSLSPNNHAEDTGAAAPAPAAPAAPLSAEAQAGQAIFFDLSRPGACAACHSYSEEGGPIGPDLAGIAKRTPRDIYQAMVKPTVPNADYPLVSVATPDGMAATIGILKTKTEDAVQIYDLSSVPPVLRSFYGARMGPAPAKPPYAHDLAGLSKDELAALITYLKSADAAPKDVTPQDLAQPQGSP